MTANHLAQGALFCGVLALVACLLSWATPRRSLADLQAEAYRAKADGDEAGPGTLVEETRRAFDVSGTKEPFHGIWVVILSALGILTAGVGALFLTLEGQFRRPAEKILRLAGVLFGVGAMLVLLDGSPGNFPFAVRATGWWMALSFSLLACFCATVGSTRVRKGEAGLPDQAPPPDHGTPLSDHGTPLSDHQEGATDTDA